MKTARKGISLATLFLFFVHLAWGAATPLGVLIPRGGASLLNGTAVTLETTVFSGDSLSTLADGLALIRLPMGDQLHFGPATTATLFGDGSGLVVSLEQGMVFVRSGNGQQVSVNANGIAVTPSEAGSFEVAIEEGTVVVAAHQAGVEVAGTNRSFLVPSGKSMRFETTTEKVATGRTGVGGQAISPGVAAAIAIAISAGVSIPVGIAYANSKAKNACEDAIQSVSPSTSTAQC